MSKTPDNSNSMEESVYDDDSESLPDGQEDDNYINPKTRWWFKLIFFN